MKIHIQNGRMIDPMNARDEVADLFYRAGKMSHGQPPATFTAKPT